MPRSKYTAALQLKADKYIHVFESRDEVIPTLEGLSIYIGISSESIQIWKKDTKNKPKFVKTCALIKKRQKMLLLSGGLKGEYSAVIAKLLLISAHGVQDKSVIEAKGTVDLNVKIRFVE